MNNKLVELEKSLPKNCCSFCTHLSLEKTDDSPVYNIRCIMLDDISPNSCCEYFEPECSHISTEDIDNLYLDFLDSCLKLDYKDYLKSIHWQLFKEKVLSYHDHRCSICNSSESVDVYHIRKNLGRESFNDVIVMCCDCLSR